MSARAALAATVLLSTLGGAARAQSNAPGFAAEVQPLLDRHCVACHQYGVAQAGLDLEDGSAHANLVGVPSTQSTLARVAPGDPDASYLLHKLAGTQANVGGSGARMPITDGGGAGISPAEIAVIRDWIAHGARND